MAHLINLEDMEESTELLPWFNSSRQFTEAEKEEVRIYQKQERFIAAKKQRQEAHQKRIEEIHMQFEETEEQIDDGIINPFVLSIWNTSIEQTRKQAIPPYAFDKFTQLPKELQLLIWSKATDEPHKRRIHLLMSMTDEYSCIGASRKEEHNPSGSTSILRVSNYSWPPKPRKGPVVLTRVSPDARNVYRETWTRMSCRRGVSNAEPDFQSYNTRDDEFYIGEREFGDFKVLIDIIIMQNTTRSLSTGVMRDITALQCVQHLIVDLNIFGAAPANIWTHFSKLKTLTIAFYPFDVISDNDRSIIDTEDATSYRVSEGGFNYHLVFRKPLRNKRFVKRAEAISILAMKSLKAVARENPTWKVPRLEVKIRKSGDEDLDFDAEHYTEEGDIYFGDNNAGEQGRVPDAEDSEMEVDDSPYLTQLPTRISHPAIEENQIKRWKQRFHPSREMSSFEAWMEGKEEKTRVKGNIPHRYFADSEGGTDDERPWRGHDDGEDDYY